MKKQKTKNMLQHCLASILAGMARSVLWRHKPCIIGITGSLGKTSTKDAIAHVLEGSFDVRKTHKNYNNEIGLPLTILGVESPGHALMGWLQIAMTWAGMMLYKKYPRVLVLEYGIDRPNDMDVLVRIARPQIAVVTNVSVAHREFFTDIAAIAQEKTKLARAVHPSKIHDGLCGVVLNHDDTRVAAAARVVTAPTYTYSMKDEADFMVSDVTLHVKNTSSQGLSFKINHEGRSVPIRLPHVLAEHHIYAVLAAIATASICKMNLVDIAERLQTYVPPVSRMRYLPGKNDTVIIDDSYNASPKAVLAALNTLAEVTRTRSIVILGDMLELGEIAEKSHAKIVKKVIAQRCDIALFVGAQFARHHNLLEEAGYQLYENLFFCNSPIVAAEIIADHMQQGDVILVKGSQGMRMEKVVESIVATSVDQRTVICRQDPGWKEIPFVPSV